MRKKASIAWGLGFILVLWYGGHILVDSRFIPNPVVVIIKSFGLLMNGSFWLHILASGMRLFISIVAASLFGTISGLLIAMNKKLDEVFSPVIYILFPVPKAAFLPVIFVLFGLSDLSRIILIFLILFFQIALSVYDAVKGLDKSLFIAAKSIRMYGWQLYRHMIIPSILPNLFTAIRISVGIAVAVLFFIETYATQYGLGYYIMNYWSLLDYEQMYCGILILSVMSYMTFRGIDYLEKVLIRWS